ncbi:hypothetical protein ROZALSC1DRAFT_31917, partial [Rozella allomycis CSF55]
PLTDKELSENLDAEVYLEDTIIKHYFSLITDVCNNCAVVDPSFFAEARHYGFETVDRSKITLQEGITTLIPIHINDHWFLTVVRVINESYQIQVYDSLKQFLYPNFPHDISLFLGADESKCEIEFVENVEKQVDAVSCGVHVCFNARSVALNQEFGDIGFSHRQLMKKELRESKLLEKEECDKFVTSGRKRKRGGNSENNASEKRLRKLELALPENVHFNDIDITINPWDKFVSKDIKIRELPPMPSINFGQSFVPPKLDLEKNPFDFDPTLEDLPEFD